MPWVLQFDAIPLVQLPNIGQDQRADKLRYESGAGFWNDPVYNSAWYWNGTHFYYVRRGHVPSDCVPNYYLALRAEVEKLVHNCPNVIAYHECERVDIDQAIPLLKG